jgi:2-oxoisovalerate dehydrogenase E2 component (dihydrolipoyl transacylase)
MREQVFLLPDLGEGLAEAEIVEWKVAVGDTVGIDQLVVEVETAKASVEVPVPFAGVVATLHAAAGDTVGVGQPLISVAADDAGAAAHEQHRREERAGSGNVLIGYGTDDTDRPRRRRVPAAARTSIPPASREPGPPTAPRVISPLVRALARDNNIDVATLVPSQPHGILSRHDIEHAIAGGGGGSALGSSAAGEIRIPLAGIRRVIADKMTTSRRQIPDATTWVDVDATNLVEARRAINAASPEVGVSLLAVLARLALAALTRFPQLNSWVDEAANEIVQFRDVHLGIAAQTPKGLVVPVIRGASSLSVKALASALQESTALAREGRLAPQRLTGGTFTLNNYGVFGVDGSTPIINHPEAAMLGVGRIVDKPWVHKGRVKARKVTQLSFTFDHRVCDGGTAGGFLRFVADCVEDPSVLLSDL